MDQRARAQQQGQPVLSSAGLRRFIVLAFVWLTVCWGLLIASPLARPAAGAVWWGGGWMLGNCVAIYGLCLAAARGDAKQRARIVTWTVFLTLGFLLIGGGLLMVADQSLLVLTIGITAVVGNFFWHLARARLRLSTLTGTNVR